MGTRREAPPAKLFMAVMHRPGFDPEALLATLAGRHGRVDARSPPFPFDRSRYYEPEMGPELVKFFVSFAGAFRQEDLAEVKLETCRLEDGHADARGRVCNIDPGIVTHYSVILATTKGYAHRIYLGRGVYAEPTLLFKGGAPVPFPWTYPDYRSEAARDFLGKTRGLLLQRPSGRGAREPGGKV